jgi:cutinase
MRGQTGYFIKYAKLFQGVIIGGGVCFGLKAKLPGKVACQGVGGDYTANVMDNGNPRGTSAGGTAEAVKMFNQAVSKCPQSKIVFGGYRFVSGLRTVRMT